MTLLVGSYNRKIVPEMTDNVSSRTLNPTIPIPGGSTWWLVGAYCIESDTLIYFFYC